MNFFCGILTVSLFLDWALGVYVDSEENIPTTVSFEPVTAADQSFMKCHNFSNYVMKCINVSDSIYSGSKKIPPIPTQITSWCKSIKHMTQCAMKWNADCVDATESHFSQESVDGHIHLTRNTCDNEKFVRAYQDTEQCVLDTAEDWRKCYSDFRTDITQERVPNRDWTHFKTYFFMCCYRMQFRKCTYITYFNNSNANECTDANKLLLQKFSVIVSESEVLQDCEFNMEYAKCPGGDPRPKDFILRSVVGDPHTLTSSGVHWALDIFYAYMVIIFLNLL